MDFSTLICSLLGIFLLFVGSCVAAEATTDVLYECYDCTYYKGPMELNPQCNDAENMDNVAKKSDCKFCKKQVLKYENETRVLIKRRCSDYCNHMKEVDLTFQDINGLGIEYCCQDNLCNVGDNAISYHKGVTLVLLASALLSLLFCLR